MTRGIDHLVLAVRDLEQARAFYASLGFTVTPRARHPWGTANHLVQLRGCFIELLGIAAPAEIPPHGPGEFSFGAHNRDFLARREGMSMLALQSHDARRDRDEFAAAGIGNYAPFDFGRDAKLPDGSTARVAFSLAFATDPRLPDQAFFACQQHAPQYFWKGEYQDHANGARTIAELFVVAPEPPTLADFFAKLQGPGSVRAEGDTLRVATARGNISVVTPALFRARFPAPGAIPKNAPATPYFAGASIACADVDEAANILRDAGVAHIREGKPPAARVPATAAFGFGLEFVST